MCITILLAPRDITSCSRRQTILALHCFLLFRDISTLWHVACAWYLPGVAPLLHLCVSPNIIRTWCGLHPLQSAAFGCPCYTLLRQQSLAVIISLLFSGRTTVCTHTLGYTKLHRFVFSDMVSKISLTVYYSVLSYFFAVGHDSCYPPLDPPGVTVRFFLSDCYCSQVHALSYPGSHHSHNSRVSDSWYHIYITYGLHPL